MKASDIKKPYSKMRSENVIREFMKKYWKQWNPKSMDVCTVKTGKFKLFISLGYDLVSYTLEGTRIEIYEQIIENNHLNAKIRKIKIHKLLNDEFGDI